MQDSSLIRAVPLRLQGWVGFCTALTLKNGVRKCRACQLLRPPASTMSGISRTSANVLAQHFVTHLARVSHGRDLEESGLKVTGLPGRNWAELDS